MFLTIPEVQRLTGRKYPSGQVRALRAMKIRHRLNAANQVLVLYLGVHRQFDDAETPIGPNFEALDALAKKTTAQ